MAVPRFNDFKSYFIYLSILTVVLLAVYYFVREKLPLSAAYIVPAFYIITAGAHYLLVQSVTKEPKKFQLYFLSAMAFKMLAYLMVLSLIVFMDGTITIEFVIAFFITYICYTGFEMIIILPMSKKK